MRDVAAVMVAALATVAAACAETPPPANGAPARRATDVAGQPEAAARACLAVPSSAHPGCYGGEAPDLRVRAGSETNADTSLSKPAINAVVRQHLAAIKCCYESQTQRSPGLAGSVVVGWKIEPSGVVSRAWIVEKTLDSQTAVDCMGEEICGWTFPPMAAPTVVGRYPIAFKR